MRRHGSIFVVLAVVALLLGCTPPEGGTIVGSGNVITREERVGTFDRVRAGNGVTRLDIRQGEVHRVIIRTEDNFVPYLHANNYDRTLSIYLEENRMAYYAGTLQAEVTMPELVELTVEARHATIGGFESLETLEVGLYSHSSLEGDVGATDLRLGIFLGSSITLTGSARNLTVRAAEGGIVNLADFPVTNASIEANTGSTVIVNPSDRLDVVAKGGSHVYYVGTPELGEVDASEDSSVGRR